MNLQRQLRWLNEQINLAAGSLPTAGDTKGLKLDPIKRLLTAIGSPEQDWPAVHITGTNGKGSTSHLTSLILREHGLRVGTYASPHVSVINERIQIDVAPISDEDFADALTTVRLGVESIRNQDPTFSPSWFELMTATAFRAFSDAAVDVAVVEVGMLGRFDATNVIDTQVAVVTNIAKDHTNGLEGWAHEVASEKAGVIKAAKPAVLGVIADDLFSYFKAEAPSSITRFGDNLHLSANELAVGGRSITVGTQRAIYPEVFVSLHGAHQGRNATFAIAAAEEFLQSELDADLLQTALAQAKVPGRFEVMSSSPLIIVDGGHNVDGAATTAATFAEGFHSFGRTALVLGMMADKDPEAMLETLRAKTMDLVICCAPNWPRALAASELAKAARNMGIDPEVVSDPAEAIEVAKTMTGPEDAILVAGSLYVAGAVRNRLLQTQETEAN